MTSSDSPASEFAEETSISFSPNARRMLPDRSFENSGHWRRWIPGSSCRRASARPRLYRYPMLASRPCEGGSAHEDLRLISQCPTGVLLRNLRSKADCARVMRGVSLVFHLCCQLCGGNCVRRHPSRFRRAGIQRARRRAANRLSVLGANTSSRSNRFGRCVCRIL